MVESDDDESWKDIVMVDDEANWDYSKEVSFSHPMLVMSAYSTAIRAGAVEMIKGFWEQRIDKQGNTINVHHPDTREVYINAVETLKNVMIADFDDEADAKMDAIYSSIYKIKKEAVEAEDKWYESLPYQARQKVSHMKNYLNENYVFYSNMMEDKVELYRKIFEQLELLIKRLKYFKKEPVRVGAK